MKKLLIAFFALFVIVGLSACDQATTYEPLDYKEVEDVGNFENYAQLKDYLDQFYTENDSYRTDYYFDSVAEGAMTTTVATSAIPAYGANDKSYSETNNQVEGVYEADRILTDGYFIYVLTSNQFVIVNADDMTITDTFQMDDNYVYGMYRYGNKIVLLSQEYHYIYDDSVSTKTGADGIYWDYYYVRFTYGARITVLDVTDRSDIQVSRSLYFEGSYLSESRMIDGYVYLVMNNYASNYGYNEDTFVPEYLDSTVSDELIQLPAQNIFYMPNNYLSFGYLMLVSFSVDDSEPADVNAYLGSCYQIFMSQDNLYTIVYRYWYDEALMFYSYETMIIRFAIEDHKLVYKAIGSVDGQPLNQFSMDEYDGYFRIATTGYEYTETTWKITNKVSIFDATTEGTIEPVSELTGLGKPNERIYAVRFSGDFGYVVTFVNTDPLYKLDLSDPDNPAILGELYEEGVSDYLHEISDNLLLGVGRQAVTEGDWTHFTGVKVSLYDITGDDPINLETYLVEGEYSYSPVTYDHKAFTSYEPTGADFMYVAIPVYEYYADYWNSAQNVYVFKVMYSGDLEMLTKLTNMPDQESQEYYYWYYDSIERTVMIDNMIYTVSYSQIQKYDMDSDFAFVARTVFDTESQYYLPSVGD